MEVDSPLVTCRMTEGSRSKLQKPQEVTTKAIQEIETLLQGAGLLGKAYNTWKHIKTAAIAGCEHRGSLDAPEPTTQAQDIKDIKTELKELSRTILELGKQLGTKGKAFYTSVVKNGNILKRLSQKNKYIILVLA